MSVGIINIKADPRLGTVRVGSVMDADIRELRIGAQAVHACRLPYANVFDAIVGTKSTLFVLLIQAPGSSLSEMAAAVMSLITKRQAAGLDTILYMCPGQDLYSMLLTNALQFNTNFVVSENLHGAYVINRSKQFAVGEVVNIKDIVDSMS